MNQRLLKNGENINSQDITLFCFPFAGGGASTYTSWIKKLKDKITVCPIQLPGREERIMEKPYTDMSELLRDLTDEIVIAIKGKYVLWGHSMGGKIAYELEKYLENKGYQAQCIFASGCRIPNIPEPNPIYHLKDEAFKRELERFGGTPKKVLENKELLDFFLPMLRADFTLADASIELLNKKIVPGIYYATDIIEGDIVLGDLPKLNIDLNISEYVMQEESFDDEFEEGTI